MPYITSCKYQLILLLIFTTSFANGQTFEWGRFISGLEEEKVEESKVDAAGNLYITGTYDKSMEFQPWADSLNLSTNIHGAYLLKYSPNGTLLWAKSWGIRSRANSLDFDNDGNVYVTGQFHIETNFNPDTGATEVPVIVYGDYDAYVSKFDSTGNFIWVKTWGAQGGDIGRSVRLDSDMNIYVAGDFDFTVDMDPGQDTFNLTGTYNGQSVNKSTFLSKFDSNGNFLWSKSFSNRIASYSGKLPIVIDVDDNLIIGGIFNTAGDYDPGSNSFIMSPVDGYDGYLLKVESDGDLIWAIQIGGVLNDNVSSMVTDTAGYIYATGLFGSQIDFDPGPGVTNLTSDGNGDVYLAKYSPSGDLVWVKQWGGPSVDKGLSVDLDPSGNLYVLAHFLQTADFDPSPSVFNLTSLSNYDASISKLNSDGDFVWAKQLASTANPLITGWGFVVDADVNIYVAGDFYQTLDLDPSPVDSFMITGSYRDMFVLKLGYCPVVYASISDTACVDYLSPSGYYTWNQSGTYLDVVPASTGCDSAIYIDLTVHQINLDVEDTQSSLIAQQDSGQFQWLDCNNGFTLMIGDTGYTFEPVNSGSYAVAILTNGCLDTSSCYSILSVGMESLEEDSLFAHPNPTNGQLFLTMPSNESITSIEVFNSIGQIVINCRGNNTSQQSIDLEPFENGLYFINVQSEHQRSLLRVVKQ